MNTTVFQTKTAFLFVSRLNSIHKIANLDFWKYMESIVICFKNSETTVGFTKYLQKGLGDYVIIFTFLRKRTPICSCLQKYTTRRRQKKHAGSGLDGLSRNLRKIPAVHREWSTWKLKSHNQVLDYLFHGKDEKKEFFSGFFSLTTHFFFSMLAKLTLSKHIKDGGNYEEDLDNVSREKAHTNSEEIWRFMGVPRTLRRKNLLV